MSYGNVGVFQMSQIKFISGSLNAVNVEGNLQSSVGFNASHIAIALINLFNCTGW